MNQRTLSVALTLIVATFTFAMFVTIDHKSCDRARATRAGLHAYFAGAVTRATMRAQVDTGLARRLDLEAVRASQHLLDTETPLSCSGVVP